VTIPSGFLLRILKSFTVSGKETWKMNIIVLRPYAFLVTELHKTFKSQEDVQVKVDSRHGEQRTKKEPFSYEHRLADRRSTKETLVEVVIST
jgi:hypothetical protein